ncbi:MAG: hypothetical protein HY047_09325 [Acidobacteria bacterium]|nr:hypothetical protein [Acidobacteriota bacterium]
MTRDFWWAALVAFALVAIGITTHGGAPPVNQAYLTSYPSDSDVYLSMVAHREMRTTPPAPDDPPWQLSKIRLPFRYRLLVPWLASLLPFGPVFSLALVNWTSLAGAYVFLLLTCRRLGLSFLVSACGLAIAFTFVSHLPIYSEPWLTDGFILLVVSGMTYAFAIDTFWVFAGWGLVGLFAREVPAVLLPIWCVRDIKRGTAVTAIAIVAIIVMRLLLVDHVGPDPDAVAMNPSGLLHATVHLVRKGPSGASFWPGQYWPPHHLRQLVTDVEYCWGWAFAILPIAWLLLPRDAAARVGPILLTLMVAAFGMSLIATDVPREFIVLLPVVVVAFAAVITALAARQRVAWLALLAGLAAAQFCLTESNVVLRQETWDVWSTRVPLIKIGVAWAVVAAFLLRSELAGRVTSPGYTPPRRAR